MNFFICSYPRSRTAWIANFLTYGPSFCFHEPFQHLDHGIEDYPKLLASTLTPHAGVSDSANALYIDRLIELFPAARIVLVRRERAEVAESLGWLGFAIDYTRILDRFERELDRIAKVYESRTLVLDYRALDPTALWGFCVPDEPENVPRSKMLEDFNVKIQREVLAANVSKGMERLRSGDTERFQSLFTSDGSPRILSSEYDLMGYPHFAGIPENLQPAGGMGREVGA